MAKLNRILVPVDFSTCSQAAVEYAAFLARLTGASVEVLHVWEAPLYPAPESVIYAGGGRRHELAEFAATPGGHQMAELLAELEQTLTGRVRGRLASGQPVEAILAALAGGGYDLVVMGTHGRRGVRRLAMGSVAEKVVRLASCPVVTIHARALAEPVAAAS